MKKSMKYMIVMILTVILMSNGLGVSAQERYSEDNIYLSFLNDLALVQKRSRICSLKTA